MFDTNAPVVLFPNYLVATSLILRDLLALAVLKNVLPSKHDPLRQYIRTLEPEKESAENLTQVYEKLKGVKLSELNPIPNIRTKFIVEDVACILIKRATGCARRICGLASTGSKTEIETSRDWAFFADDLQVVHAIVSSRVVFIPDMILKNYLVALEGVQTAIGHNIPADLMCNKLRTILKGASRAQQKPQAVEHRNEVAPEPEQRNEVTSLPEVEGETKAAG